MENRFSTIQRFIANVLCLRTPNTLKNLLGVEYNFTDHNKIFDEYTRININFLIESGTNRICTVHAVIDDNVKLSKYYENIISCNISIEKDMWNKHYSEKDYYLTTKLNLDSAFSRESILITPMNEKFFENIPSCISFIKIHNSGIIDIFSSEPIQTNISLKFIWLTI